MPILRHFYAILTSFLRQFYAILTSFLRQFYVSFTIYFKDELLFNSWKEMFDSDGSNNAALGDKRIYTFGGRDILTDKRW